MNLTDPIEWGSSLGCLRRLDALLEENRADLAPTEYAQGRVILARVRTRVISRIDAHLDAWLDHRADERNGS